MVQTFSEGSRTRRWQRWLRWVGFAALAAPLGLVLHELGHYLTYRAFGFTDVALHSTSVSLGRGEIFWQFIRADDFAAAANVYPLGQVALAAAMGPLVSAFLTVMCCLIASRKPHPFVVSLGLFSPLQFVGGLIYLPASFFRKLERASFDELNVARLLGIPVEIFILLGAFLLVGGTFWLLRCIPKGNRLFAVSAIIAGVIVGLGVYLTLLAPALLG
jgi:hypothetical protein